MRGLRKIAKPKHGRRFPATRDDPALEATRQRPCLLRGKRTTVLLWKGAYPDKVQEATEFVHTCWGPVEAHHVVTKARGGQDRDTVPLCRAGHAGLHDMGQAAFERAWGIRLGKGDGGT